MTELQKILFYFWQTQIWTKLQFQHNLKNVKIQIVTKLKLLKLKWWQNSKYDKTQNATKLKLWPILNGDQTQTMKKKTCDKSQIVTKFEGDITKNMTKVKVWWKLKLWEKKAQSVKKIKLKMWWHFICDQFQNFTKLKFLQNLNCDKRHFVAKLKRWLS